MFKIFLFKPKILFIGALLSSCLYSNDTIISTVSKDKNLLYLEDFLKEKLPENNKSIGLTFLENEYNQTLKDTNSIVIKEVYTKEISNNWKGGIFEIDIINWDNSKEKYIRKLFYNDSLIVNDIFTKDGLSMAKDFNMPLLSNIVYNKEYQILKQNKNLPALYGNDMVIFTNLQCMFCKRYVPAMYEYALNNNMNLYVIHLTSNNHSNSEDLASYLLTFIKKSELSDDKKIEILSSIYQRDFISTKEDLLKEFNSIIGKDNEISLKDIENFNSKRLLKINNELAKKIYIRETPTVYIDDVLFTEYSEDKN